MKRNEIFKISFKNKNGGTLVKYKNTREEVDKEIEYFKNFDCTFSVEKIVDWI